LKDSLERIYNRPFKRKPVKNINLGIIYGQGVPSLAVKNGESIADTKMLRDSILKMYPGIKSLSDGLKFRARTKQPLRTWGGREYYCEPPIIKDGKIINFEYKMVNTLVQSSAADCTKEGMIRFYERQGDAIEAIIARMHNRGWKMILQVHDEIVLSVPAEDMVEAQTLLRDAMESVEFDVKILSEGAWSNDNWSVMKDFDKKGVRIKQDLPRQKRKAA
jgi:DNA polymerase-1